MFCLKPTIRISEFHLLENEFRLNEELRITEELVYCYKFDNGNEILKQWIRC